LRGLLCKVAMLDGLFRVILKVVLFEYFSISF
jgi:hypothetical protein